MDKRPKKRVSVGVLIVALLIAFVAGNRLQMVGEWFFAPYTTKSNSTLSQNLDFTSTEKVYDLLKQKFDGELDMTKLSDGMKRGLVGAAGDPYTVYMSEQEAKEFQADLEGTFTGIGAELGKRNDKLVVISPLEGSPAQKAGLQPGDEIVKIDADDATKLSVDEAVNKIRGEAGTEVTLGIIRENVPIEVKITRAQINIPSVTSEIIDGVGYLKINRFSDDTAELASKAATDFKAQNVKGVVLDLRNNGGGLVDSAVKVSGLWLNKQVVVEEREGGRTRTVLKSGDNAPLAGVPTVVLINEGSASASEIVAGALRDHNAAQLIGMKSFGKGSVQELINLSDGGKLKVTVARWFTPGGKNIDKEGISPDIQVERTIEDFNANRDPQKDRALQEVRQ